MNFLLDFIFFLSILDAIVVKYLLKWLATSKGFADIFPFILRFIKLLTLFGLKLIKLFMVFQTFIRLFLFCFKKF